MAIQLHSAEGAHQQVSAADLLSLPADRLLGRQKADTPRRRAVVDTPVDTPDGFGPKASCKSMNLGANTGT